MRAVVIGLVAVGLLGSANTARADNKDMIVGTWELVYSDAKEIPPGTKLEFTPDGKMKLTVKGKDGKERTEDGGGYKIDKDFITLTGKDNSRNDKGRVALLNKSSFIFNDEIEDKLMVFKKVKGK